MEFCRNWNQPGSTCECNTCLGPWIENEMGYWQHAFDQLLFSHVEPKRNVIPLEHSESDEEKTNVNKRQCDSPVSSISDQYSTDDTYTPNADFEGSISENYSDVPSSDGILANRDETNEPSDSDTIIESTDDDDIEETKYKEKHDNSLLFDFTPYEQEKLEKMFDSVFYTNPPNTPRPVIIDDNAIASPPPFNYFEYPELNHAEQLIPTEEDFQAQTDKTDSSKEEEVSPRKYKLRKRQ